MTFLSGLAHVTLPYPASTNASKDEAWILGGPDSLLVANDVLGTGHITTYPSDEKTIGLQIPFAGGLIPPHRILYEGPCHYSIDEGQELVAVIGL